MEKETPFAGGELPEEAAISEQRKQSQKEWDIRARERNKYRTLYQKLFGLEKTSGMDIAIEEAMEINRDIEEEMETGKAKTAQEAMEIIQGRPDSELQPKEKKKIRAEERMRARAVLIAKAIDENMFHRIWQYRQDLTDETSETLKEVEAVVMLDKIIRSCLREKIETAVKGGDIKTFVSAVFFCGGYIRKSDLDSVRDILKEPGALDQIKVFLGYRLRSACYEKKHVDELFYDFEGKRLGIVDREEVFRFPAVRRLMEKEIVEEFEKFYKEPGLLKNFYTKLEKMGIISLPAIRALPSLQQGIKEKLTTLLLTGDKNFFSYLRDQYVDLEILSKEEADKIALPGDMTPIYLQENRNN